MKSFLPKRNRLFLSIGFMAWIFFTAFYPSALSYTTSSYADNFTIPEAQAGASGESYEGKAARKLQRGIENFFLCSLEIPQGIKAEAAQRKSEYLPVGLESFFIGTVRGVGNGFKRMGVGLYEMFTFTYAQDPILPEMSDWAY